MSDLSEMRDFLTEMTKGYVAPESPFIAFLRALKANSCPCCGNHITKRGLSLSMMDNDIILCDWCEQSGHRRKIENPRFCRTCQIVFQSMMEQYNGF